MEDESKGGEPFWGALRELDSAQVSEEIDAAIANIITAFDLE